MGLFYLVEQQHAVGGLADGVGQQPTVLVTHIAGGRTDEFGHRVLLGVFAHVEPDKLHAHLAGEHLGHFGLAHTRRTDEQQRGKGLVVVEQAGLRHLDGFDHLAHGLVLTVDAGRHALVQRLQGGVVVVLHRHGVDLAHLGEYLGNQCLVDHPTAVGGGMQFAVGAGLVDEVDGLVGQETVVDELRA